MPITQVAIKWLENHSPHGTLNTWADGQTQFPEEDPHRDPNDDQSYQKLKWYQEALTSGMKEGGKRAMNMAKTSEVLQGPKRVQLCTVRGCVRPSGSIHHLTQKHQKTSRRLVPPLAVRPRDTLGQSYRSLRALLGRAQVS